MMSFCATNSPGIDDSKFVLISEILLLVQRFPSKITGLRLKT